MLAIPGPVVAAYLGVLLAMIFIVGMSVAMRDGIDYRKGLIIGVSFWVGIGFQYDMIYPEHVSEIAGGLLRNGGHDRRRRGHPDDTFRGIDETTPQPSRGCVRDPPRCRRSGVSSASSPTGTGGGAAMAARLDAACEETLLTLLHQDDGSDVANPGRRLRLAVHREGTGAVVEFVVAAQDVNLQDRLALIGDEPGATPAEREVSLRLLRGLASSVHHQQYHGVDIVTVRVAAPMSGAD